MDSNATYTLKVIAGGVLVMSLVFSFLEKWFEPTYMVSEKPKFPDWMGWVTWCFAAVAAITYIAIDVLSAP
ncbi:hypothetical protein H4W19_03465 [Pseudoxanthomonas mexicana]|uniref:Uncharacterized protein n=1 Tax=Pseudoxanthomonas mexicana TaxID=128785 RepID=A0ABX6RC97_PSEMX|nr:hypothetical protein [Pseudoxanthomonas mexicana]QLQ29310.1 MAG: hypothetical protein HZT39_14705 [Pseudoxanthomonas sp.]QND80870.1 hypothetical protein H4W19_03465 [Pseudoxanthomonas mexicana]